MKLKNNINTNVFTWHTAHIRVPGESLGTEADRLVVGDEALGVGAAAARVNAVPAKHIG